MRTETLHLAKSSTDDRARCGWKPFGARAWVTEHLGDVRCRRCKALAAKDATKAVIRPRSLAHLPGTSTEPIWTNPTYRATADEITRAAADAQVAPVALPLTRLSEGRYHVAGCLVERTPDGWRWSRYGAAGTGGEWRATRREAVLDLQAYLTALELAESLRRCTGATAVAVHDSGVTVTSTTNR